MSFASLSPGDAWVVSGMAWACGCGDVGGGLSDSAEEEEEEEEEDGRAAAWRFSRLGRLTTDRRRSLRTVWSLVVEGLEEEEEQKRLAIW